MALKLLIALFGLVALATIASAATCAADFNNCNSGSYQGSCYADFDSADSYCACRSGASGDSCQTPVPNGCTLGSLNATKTEYPPVAVAVVFDNDLLNVTISSPLVAQRNYSVVAIDDSAFDKKECTYPGLYWSRSVNSCTDVFSGSMPWANNVRCGWVANQTDVSYAVYSAQMIVRHHDFSVPFGSRPGSDPVERITDHLIPLTISFPKNITVNSDIVVQAPVKVIMAVSRQNVSTDGARSNIEITTNVLWPYTLTNFTIGSNPGGSGATYTPSLVSTNCPNDGSSSCTQVFRISIENGANCNLNGDYLLRWNITCQLTGGNLPAQCAIQSTDGAVAGLSTSSENFCTVISTVLPLTGSLASYGNIALSQPKTQFLVGQTLYYQASVVAPNITLTATTINSVKLTSAGQSTVILYSGLANTAAGNTASFSPYQSNASAAAFSFVLDGSFIDAIPDDSSRSFSTVVIVDVDYLNTVTQKRGVATIEFTSNLNTQPVGLSATFDVNKPASSSAASFSYNLLLAFVAIALLALKMF